MKTHLYPWLSAAALAALTGLTLPAQAGPLIAVQFGGTGSTPAQAGFDLRTKAPGSQMSFTALDLNGGTSDLTIQASFSAPGPSPWTPGIDMRSPAPVAADGPLANLLSGFFFLEDRVETGELPAANGLEFEITGLPADTVMTIDIYSYDNRRITNPDLPTIGKSFSAGRTSFWSSNLETVSFTTADELLPSTHYDFLLRARTDAQGTLRFSAASDLSLNQPTVFFNGFTISVPEPGAASLAALGLLGLVAARRRHRPRAAACALLPLTVGPVDCDCELARATAGLPNSSSMRQVSPGAGSTCRAGVVASQGFR